MSLDYSTKKTIENEMSLLGAKLNSVTKKNSFELKPNTRTCNFKVTPHDDASCPLKMSAKFSQIPVNSSDAITGHKLQGLTKDSLVVYEWDSDTCWIYVVLSRVRTLKGLYLIRPISKADIKPANTESRSTFSSCSAWRQGQILKWSGLELFTEFKKKPN